jgi:group I intron endonuclease
MRIYGRIYVVTNLVNGKQYVGQTTRTCAKRWQGHCWEATAGRKNGLCQAIRKYGRENFKLEELVTAAGKEELDALEAQWVETLHTITPWGYNLMGGGGSAGRPSRETIERRRRALTGHPTSQATRDKISNAQVGRVFTPEHREKLRRAKLGRKQNPEMVARRNAAIRTAYSERHDEIVPKITRVHVGRRHSEETKAKMRVSARNRVS